MSHFSTAVFMYDNKQSFDNLLVPYDEDSTRTVSNPDAKFDWYVTGGIWRDTLMLRPGRKGIRGASGDGKKRPEGYDGAFVRDIDFEAMRKASLKRKRGKRNLPFSTYAVITPDVKWHAQGEMGWCGISSGSSREERIWRKGYYDRFIKPALENNWYMVIVDCHI